MKITHYRDLATERWHSMERYADELARKLPELGCEIESFAPVRPLPNLRGAANTAMNYVWRTLVYPHAARNHQGEINHIVDHSYAHLIHALDPRKTLVTCHDIAPLALNQGQGIARRLWDQSFRAMLHASRIITDSLFTRDEILRHADYPKECISVVPLGVGEEFFTPVQKEDTRAQREQHHLTSRRIILHVGSCEPRKNVELILHALQDLGDLDSTFLQIGGCFSHAQLRLIDGLKLRQRVQQIPFADEHQLRAWYQIADAFVLPSYYEGFGLPILEAMAMRAPVICSNTTSLPEVAGDAALLVDPHNPSALAEAIRSVLTDPVLSADLRRRGLERSGLYTWEATARKTLQVYEQIIE